MVRGFQDVSQELFGLAQERLRTNTEALKRIAQCRSVQDLVAVQTELVRDNLQQFLDATRRVVQVSLRSAEEATRTMEAEDTKNTHRNRRAAEATAAARPVRGAGLLLSAGPEGSRRPGSNSAVLGAAADEE